MPKFGGEIRASDVFGALFVMSRRSDSRLKVPILIRVPGSRVEDLRLEAPKP